MKSAGLHLKLTPEIEARLEALLPRLRICPRKKDYRDRPANKTEFITLALEAFVTKAEGGGIGIFDGSESFARAFFLGEDGEPVAWAPSAGATAYAELQRTGLSSVTPKHLAALDEDAKLLRSGQGVAVRGNVFGHDTERVGTTGFLGICAGCYKISGTFDEPVRVHRYDIAPIYTARKEP